MANEQCGICWNLKLDRKGKETHGLLHSHDFTPFDYCIKCKKPKFDHRGFLTHPSRYDLMETDSVNLDHEFYSANYSKEMARKKRRKIILGVSGTLTLVIAPVVNVLHFLY
ncbi:MAG: hypothetical protein R3237_03330 [Nitrosopumilaceae archaeon]|nr:hypothetical protein [Nitrosopumilaceae archaeon]